MTRILRFCAGRLCGKAYKIRTSRSEFQALNARLQDFWQTEQRTYAKKPVALGLQLLEYGTCSFPAKQQVLRDWMLKEAHLDECRSA